MKKTEKFLGIDIFKWESWEDYREYEEMVAGENYNCLQFTDTEWEFDSMKKYNGCTIILNRFGYYKVIDMSNPNNEVYSICKDFLKEYSKSAVLDEGYLSKIPEFKSKLIS